jgi:acyl-CoA dehydrogenase
MLLDNSLTQHWRHRCACMPHHLTSRAVYCLLVNRAQFLHEQSHLSNSQNVNFSRATLCELVATRILRRFGEDNPGKDGLILLANILVAGFEPFQNAPESILRHAEDKLGWIYQRPLPALEVAILTESKHFLSSTTCQKVYAPFLAA